MELEFGTKRIKPIIRMLFDMKDVIYDKEWLSKAKNMELYYMYRDLSLSKNDALAIKEQGIRYDITVIPPRMLGREFVKTAGHYHPLIKGMALTYPEIYEVLNGEAMFLMQKTEGDEVKDIILVKAGAGDKVIILPNYGHISINASNKVLKMANFVARDFESIYEPIKEKGGSAYFVLENGIVKNPCYKDVPEIRSLEPANAKIGLPRSKEMYGLVREPKKLEFLTKPQEYEWLFEGML